MTMVVLGGRPPELEALIARRRALGLDRHDEVWAGEYHVAPYADGGHAWLSVQVALAIQPRARARGLFAYGTANLGEPDDFRVPDGLVARQRTTHLYFAAAAMAIEILSPDDDTFRKFPFYAERGVEEILVADWRTRSVRCWQLSAGGYRERSTSALLDVALSTLVDEIDWP